MIEKHNGMTIYSQVKSDIEFKIKHEIYKVGDKLPTNMQLCDIYNVSRITINRALAELEADGYIEKHQGKGCYVRFKEINQNMSSFYRFTDELKKMGMVPSAEFVSLKLISPGYEVANALGIGIDENVFLLKRLRLADGVIVAYDRSYIPEKYIPNFGRDKIVNDSLYEGLQQHYGFRPNHSEETIEAVIIDDKDAKKMKIEPNSPVLKVRRVSYYNGTKVEFNSRIVNSKVFKYKMTLE